MNILKGSLTLSEEALGDFKKYKQFKDLPLMLKRKILNTEFFVTVLNPGVTQSDRYRIYEMGSVTEGSSDLWSVAKFVFQKAIVILKNSRRNNSVISKRKAESKTDYTTSLAVEY